STDESGFRYCTECVVNGVDIDRRKLREALSALGDSLVLAGTKRKAKIHIHADDPERVFEAAGRFGSVSAQKADDMQLQQRSTHGISARFAVITDSAADIPEALLEELDIHLVPLRVQFGDRGYLDKVSITPTEFFEKLRETEVAPTTSQPSPGDFRRHYQFLASHYPDVISVSLTGGVSGTLQAAQSAASRVDASGRVHVVDTRNASLGQGLLTILAAECARSGCDARRTIELLERAIPDTISFAIVKDLTWAVRGGRVPKSRKLIADLLRVTPVLRTTPDGKVSSGGILPGRRRPLRRFARYIADHAPAGELQFLVGHAQAPEDAEALVSEIESVLPRARCRGTTSIGTALGVHAGPGALVVGVQRRVAIDATD
ncbi:MAG: DegV family protein, partial [Woeseiaceae bacterium]|nr:DegV family protein [Woeseiaceae bacterium]